jgi:hypothetical protein
MSIAVCPAERRQRISADAGPRPHASGFDLTSALVHQDPSILNDQYGNQEALMNRMLTLALGCALVLVPGTQSIAEDGQIHPVLTVQEWTQDWEDLTVTVENLGDSFEQGVLVVWFYDSGEPTGWGVPMTVPPYSLVTVGLRLTDGGAILGPPLMYSDEPTGITDAADPVMLEVEPSDGKKKGRDKEDPPPED